jgi:hypothetical protein
MLPWWIRLYRLGFGTLAIVAVIKNYVDLDDPNFWRFFTNQSNAVAGVVLILGSLFFTRWRSPLWWDVVRGTTVLMLLVTGIVYALLLDGIYNPFDGSHRWASTVLHQVMPIAMTIEILLVPLHRSVPMWSAFLFAVYPLVYLGYTLWHGAETGWYPYSFLDPAENSGADGVAITVILMLVGFLLIAALIIRLGKIMRRGHGAEPLRSRAF